MFINRLGFPLIFLEMYDIFLPNFFYSFKEGRAKLRTACELRLAQSLFKNHESNLVYKKINFLNKQSNSAFKRAKDRSCNESRSLWKWTQKEPS